MSVINIEMFNNHVRQVKEFTLTCDTLEDYLRNIRYSGENRIKDEVVENLLLPPIALTFYNNFYECGIIPTETELIDEYLEQEYFKIMGDEVEVSYDNRVVVVSKEGLIGRILRTYPSLIRDFHFYLMVYESREFDAVRYSFIDDYQGKVDLKILYKGKWYNVGLLLGSKRSLFYRFKKKFRHKDVDLIYIELNKSEADWVGDFMLYTQTHLKQLIKQIKKSKPL